MWTLVKKALRSLSRHLVLLPMLFPLFAALIVLSIVYWEQLYDWWKGDTENLGGLILVDSPEVYSRERLVNDRFKQSAWLEQQLNNTDGEDFGNQAVADLHNVLRIQGRVSVGMSSESADGPLASRGSTDPNRPQSVTTGSIRTPGKEEAESQNKNSSESPKNRPSEATSSPIEKFRDKLVYREEIRSEIMETLLDDRHDLMGNTVYRLKFDTTIIPHRDLDSWAVVHVEISPSESCKSDREDSSHRICQENEWRDIYEDWLRRTEMDFLIQLKHRIRNFKERATMADDLLDFYRFLDLSLQKMLPDLNDLAIVFRIGKNLSDILSLLEIRDQQNTFFINQPGDQNFNPYRDFSHQKLRSSVHIYLIAKFLREKREKEVDHKEESHAREWLRYLKAGERLNLSGVNRLQRWVRNITLACESYNSFREKARFDCEQKTLSEFGLLDIGEKVKYIEKSLMFFHRSPSVIDVIQGETALFEEVFADYLLYKFGVIHKLACLVDLRVIGCELGYCRISVQSRGSVKRFFESESNDFEIYSDNDKECANDTPIQNRREVSSGFPPRRFIEQLQPAEIFSYAVTPKESVQRISELTSNQRLVQLLLAMNMASKITSSQQQSDALTNTIQESQRLIHQIKRQPIIIGFGRAQSSEAGGNGVQSRPIISQPSTTQNSSGEQRHNNRAIQTEFGWLIGPKFALDSGKKNAGMSVKWQHVPIQNSLIAVISVPTWWKGAKVTVSTCWVSPKNPEFPRGETGRRPICPRNSDNSDETSKPVEYHIRLPGSAVEIPRKLGYSIARVPHMDPDAPQVLGSYYIGQRDARVLITGGELWRSTVVTMGAQQADEIVVMPNMRAIIAIFREIKNPLQWEHGGRPESFPSCPIEVPVVVWTSEGQTSPRYVRLYRGENEYKTPSPICGPIEGQASRPVVDTVQ